MSETISSTVNTTKRQCLRVAIGLSAAAFTFAGSTKAKTLHWRERAMVALGTTLSLRAGHASAERADLGLEAAVSAIRHVELHMSLFNPESALCRLNRDGVLHQPDPEFFKILTIAQNVSENSQGAFDVTVQPIWNAWQNAKKLNRFPSKDELNVALRLTGWRNLEITPQRIRFLKPGMALTLNGIAQGFASDLAREALRINGIEHALIDTGEWSAIGQSPIARPWSLGLENPRNFDAIIAKIESDGRAIATSSDAHSSFSSDFKNHHIFDPKTGYSPRDLASVTVLAPSCTMADALTKVIFMAGPNQAFSLAKKWQVDVIVVDKLGGIKSTPALKYALLT